MKPPTRHLTNYNAGSKYSNICHLTYDMKKMAGVETICGLKIAAPIVATKGSKELHFCEVCTKLFENSPELVNGPEKPATKTKHEWVQSPHGQYMTCKVCGVVKSKEGAMKECHGVTLLRDPEKNPFLHEGEKLIQPPEGGWKQHTLYLVKVAWVKSNPIHYAYLETGFINEDGTFGNYCEVWCNSYDHAIDACKAHYLVPVKELNTEGH